MIEQETLPCHTGTLGESDPAGYAGKAAETRAASDVSGSAVSASIGDYDCAASVYST